MKMRVTDGSKEDVNYTYKIREVYCSDCHFRTGCKAYGYCSHIKNRQKRKYDYRQKEKERYNSCSIVNHSGRCEYFQQKELSIIRKVLNYCSKK